MLGPPPESLVFPWGRRIPGWPSIPSNGRGVIASRMKRVTPGQPLEREPESPGQSVAEYCLPRKFRAGGLKTAGPGEKRGNSYLVSPEEPGRPTRRPSHVLAAAR